MPSPSTLDRDQQTLDELETLADIERLIRRIRDWTDRETRWEPARRAAELLRRILDRTDRIRSRLALPLVVATFGGTGTGKSTLVNALVGQEVSRSGKQRPTTTRPVLIAGAGIDLEPLELPLGELEVVRVDADPLDDFVIVDCPDPDTDGAADNNDDQSNLARLRRLLPHCDVLLYCSTQQKYRSARVLDELREAATGCRVIFVQTHADRDSDIRDDWRTHLSESFEVPELFFLDGPAALEDRRSGREPVGEFARLLATLDRELNSTQRWKIRGENVIELLSRAVDRSREDLGDKRDAVAEFQSALDEQRRKYADGLTEQLRSELDTSRHVWERQLLSRAAEMWGFSPFSSMLRLYNGLGGLLASMSLLRARTTAQVAVLGALEGARWVRSQTQETLADERLARLGRFGAEDARLRESRLVVSGYTTTAGFDADLLQSADLDDLRNRAARVEGEFLLDTRGRIERAIDRVAKASTGWLTRFRYDLLFLIYPLFVLYRVGRNFFYDSYLVQYLDPNAVRENLLTTEFYIPAVLFFVIWTGLLVLLFASRLRRGLGREMDALASGLSDRQLAAGLFPKLETEADRAIAAVEELDRIGSELEQVAPQITGTTGLGGRSDTISDRS